MEMFAPPPSAWLNFKCKSVKRVCPTYQNGLNYGGLKVQLNNDQSLITCGVKILEYNAFIPSISITFNQLLHYNLKIIISSCDIS